MNGNLRRRVECREEVCLTLLDTMACSGDVELARNAELMDSDLRCVVARGDVDGIDRLVGEAMGMLADKGLCPCMPEGVGRGPDEVRAEAYADLAGEMIRRMKETGDPDLLRHVRQMSHERWEASALRDEGVLASLIIEATARLRDAGWLV